MKKFLTVLLVIAVMFTFSFSSAFASYSWEQGTFGLADAQAEATSYVNAYDLSDFTGATYYTLQAVKATALASISDATYVSDVSDAVSDFEDAVDAADTNTEVADATKTSIAQLREFATLLVTETNALDAVDDNIEDVVKDAEAAMNAATTVKGVEKALEDGIAAIKKIVLDVNADYDFDKSELLNASLYVRTYADKVWRANGNDASHTDLVKSEYTALVNQAVAEAKAINSVVALEAFKVKYGLDPRDGKLFSSKTNVYATDTTLSNFANDNYVWHKAGVYVDEAKKDFVVYRSGYSVLAAKAMETKLSAVNKEIAKTALAELGAYDASAIYGTNSDSYCANWAAAEEFYDELNDAADYGKFGAVINSVLTGDAAVVENATAAQKSTCVDAIVAAYAQYTKVEAAKVAASATVFGDYDAADDYSTANGNAVSAYQTAFVKELGNAKTVADVEALEDKYVAILDDIETLLEASKTSAIKKFNKVIDDAVAAVKTNATIKATMTSTAGVDEPGAIDAVAARLKEIAKAIVDAGTEPASFTNVSGFKAASELNVLFNNATGEFASLTSLLEGIGGDFSHANANFATTMNYVYALPTATDLGYFDQAGIKNDPVNNTALENSAYISLQTSVGAVQNIYKGWNPTTFDWSMVVTMRKAQLDQIAAYTNTYSICYPVLVERADAAVAKLATPEKTDAFAKLLEDAAADIKAVDDWYEKTVDDGFDASAMGYYDKAAYNAAVEAYAKLVYEAIEGTGTDTDAWKDFAAIETWFDSAADKNGQYYLSSADKGAAATICAQAWAAKAAAKTDAAVDDAAETAIAALDALTVDGSVLTASSEVSAADLAALLAKAQSYFAYYEKANFTSAATTKLGLAKDIVNFYNFALDEEEAKAYVQDLAITARSAKTAKGNIKVTLNANVAPLKEAGYTVEYKFYRSTKARSGYKLMITKKTNTYTNTSGTKGVKYFYKAKLVVKDANGAVVATTPLTQCKYACRVK